MSVELVGALRLRRRTASPEGTGVAADSPLAGGLLTGKYRRGETGRPSAHEAATSDGMQREAVLDTVLSIADEIDGTAVQVSLAWLRRRSTLANTALIPIVGPRTLAHLEAYLDSLDLELSDEHYRRLDEVSAPRLGTPHEDVAAASRHGFDGDRSLLDSPAILVV